MITSNCLSIKNSEYRVLDIIEAQSARQRTK